MQDVNQLTTGFLFLPAIYRHRGVSMSKLRGTAHVRPRQSILGGDSSTQPNLTWRSPQAQTTLKRISTEKGAEVETSR